MKKAAQRPQTGDMPYTDCWYASFFFSAINRHLKLRSSGFAESTRKSVVRVSGQSPRKTDRPPLNTRSAGADRTENPVGSVTLLFCFFKSPEIAAEKADLNREAHPRTLFALTRPLNAYQRLV